MWSKEPFIKCLTADAQISNKYGSHDKEDDFEICLYIWVAMTMAQTMFQ